MQTTRKMTTSRQGEILQALMALEKGDFSARLPEDSTSVDPAIARAFNGIAARNKALAADLERASHAASEGLEVPRPKLGDAQGGWAKSLKSINRMVELMNRPAPKPPRGMDRGDHSFDTSLLFKTLLALKKGDFSVRLPQDWAGIPGKIADTFNDVVERNDQLTRELERVSRVVGREGKISQRATLGGAVGSWNSL